jgi:cytidylate kinase
MTVRIPAIERIAEENLRRRELSEQVQKRIKESRVEDAVGPYLAISRETGAGGGEIARLVGERLGWDVLDKEIIDTLAVEYGTPRQTVESVDEKSGHWIDEIFSSWIQGQGFTTSAYVHRIGRLFLLAAHHGNVVIVGRGGRYLLPRDCGISVRIVAPLEYRIATVESRLELPAKQAKRFVTEADARRDAFIQEHFHHQAADPHMYDLVINVERLSRDVVADMIVSAMEGWIAKSGIAKRQTPK